MSSHILVAGGAGYVGSHTAKALSQAGFTPVVYDDLSAGYEHNVKWGPLERGDIRDGERLDAVLAAYDIKAVLHFAARIEVGEGERDPESFYDNNVYGSLCLLRALRKAGGPPLIFSSTCAVYGRPQTPLLDETHPRAPESVYGRSKLMIEQAIADYGRAYGMPYALLRYFNASGADRDGELGEEHEPETHLIPNALAAAAGRGQTLKIFGTDYDTPDGTCLRDYIHVEDLAQGHILALRRLLDGERALACNLGTGAGDSVRDVIRAIETVTGRTVPAEEAGRRPGDVPALVADTSFAKSLGFAPARSDMTQIVTDAWRFYAAKAGLA